MARKRQPIVVDNPADGGYLYWLAKLSFFAAWAGLGLMVLALAGVYLYFALEVPRLPEIDDYANTAPGVTRIYAWDGALLGEFASEHRDVVPLTRIPKVVIQAFLAAEDRRFFEHRGLDLRGIVRAIRANWRKGRVTQGGSTITQQVAKAFLSPERSLARKIREAIVARRLEARYDKNDILTLYLNQLYLGNGAYGVQAAARRYFDRDVWELGTNEAALLAGLARAPSRYSPVTAPRRARTRRNQVLQDMVEAGFLAADRAQELSTHGLGVSPRPDHFRDGSPYFTEHVRRVLLERYGKERVYREGLVVETTLLPVVDAAAQESVDFTARKLDKRQGWRGPETNLATGPARATFLKRSRARYGTGPLAHGRRYLALVEKVEARRARVRVASRAYQMEMWGASWAAPYSKRNPTNDRAIGNMRRVLKVGDVVWVRLSECTAGGKFRDWHVFPEEQDVAWISPTEKLPCGPRTVVLEQTPKVEGLLYTFDHDSGYVHAMAGGVDFDRSEFNRVTQGYRQPGSAYKPIYYSLGLEQGYSYSFLLNDTPKTEIDPVTGEVWVPVNYDNKIDYQASLERSLVWSKNVPSVDLFTRLGGKEVEAWARRLGFTTEIHPDKALALGASAVHPDEISRAFAIFARNGTWIDPVYIRRVRDRQGLILEDHTVYWDPQLPPGDRLDRLAAQAGVPPRQAIPTRSAFLMSKLLRRAVQVGYYKPIRQTGIPAACKTGTSSATMDVWAICYTPKWLTTAWLGDERRERMLGFKDVSYMLTVPMWARYMHEVADQHPKDVEIPWVVPSGVKPNDLGGPLKPRQRALDATRSSKNAPRVLGVPGSPGAPGTPGALTGKIVRGAQGGRIRLSDLPEGIPKPRVRQAEIEEAMRAAKEGTDLPAAPGRPKGTAPGAPGKAAPGAPGKAAPGAPGKAAPGAPGKAAPGAPGKAAPGAPGVPGKAGPGAPGKAGPGATGQTRTGPAPRASKPRRSGAPAAGGKSAGQASGKPAAKPDAVKPAG